MSIKAVLCEFSGLAGRFTAPALARSGESDVDLLVEFFPGAKTYRHFLALAELLEGRLGRRVELVTKEALSPFLGPRILAEAEDVLRTA
ncbi:MAG: nucleotidyltransferase family protein [Bryobacteraceae bacterium]